ncbi:WhiB family transcriptional regulator [Brevibacterium casei]|uniref:WhiB family transcriptional regulator n=2 Tax=Brevibacterium casei TaxID=33889 RepID=A0A7T2WPY5_9MICO|nr:WhiB family transcriptional regulator [Brevibacterium casei]
MATIERDYDRLDVDTRAGRAHYAIAFALKGKPAPCMTGHGDDWLSGDRETRRQAVQACSHCPAMTSCRNFAKATRAEFGVFGGEDFTRP